MWQPKPAIWAPGIRSGHPLARGLAGYWEMSGVPTRNLVNAAEAHTYTNMDASNVAIGPFGPGVSFNGTNEKFVANGSGVIQAGASWTLRVVVNINSAKWQNVFGNTDTNTWFMGFESTNRVYHYITGYGSIASSVLPLSTTLDIVTLYTGSSRHCYIDGKLNWGGVIGSAPTADLNLADIEFGRVKGTDYFDGTVYTVMLYDRALIAGEIQELYSDPWSLIRPRQRTYFPVAASGSAPGASIIPIIGYHRRWMKVA